MMHRNMDANDRRTDDAFGRTQPRTPARGGEGDRPRDPIGETRPRSIPQDPGITRPNSPLRTGRVGPGERAGQGRQPPDQKPPDKVRKTSHWWRWLLVMLLYGLIILGIAGVGGYLTGLEDREALAAGQRAQALQEQFDLGVQDLLAGRLEIARQRFDFILSEDPQFPGALELLEEARAGLNEPTLTPSATASPTSAATPTPTLDLGSIDGLFATAQTAQVQSNWTGVIEALVAILAEAPEYRPDEVDQMLFSALRSRGLEKIWAGQQEEGIYDLALAERIYPLDSQADSWRRSAAFYLFANSYFGLDWELATRHFAQICQAGIWDGCFKYARSAWEYADLLFEEEDPCEAVVQYEASLLTLEDAAKAPTATESFNVCMTATAPSPTPTITPTLGTVTGSPTFAVTETPTPPGPTLTPTASFTITPPGAPSKTPTPIPTATETPTPSPTAPPTETSTTAP